MNFSLTEEQIAVKEAARVFAEANLLPGVIQRDKEMSFPSEQVKEMGQLGFLGMMVDPVYDGGGMDTLSYVLALEEIAKVDASCAVIMSVNNSLVCWCIDNFATEDQKNKFLSKLAIAEQIGSFCLSEPGAGSDATKIQTTAIDKGDYYLVNGTKNWITNGSSSSIHLLIAQSDKSKSSKGINAFIVEADSEGISIGNKEDKMGIRSSDTTSITYTNVKVPKENRLGEEGSGFAIAMKTLVGGRIGIAAQALGIAEGAFQLALKYSKQREAFGVPIVKHQAISFKIAQMATEIEAARQLVYEAARTKDRDEDYTMIASMAKLMASEVAMRQTVEAVQIHGGYGYVREYHVERHLRDAKITEIYEGTSEIQRLIIVKNIMNGKLYH